MFSWTMLLPCRISTRWEVPTLTPFKSSSQSLGVVSPTPFNSFSAALTQGLKYQSELGIKNNARLQRLEVKTLPLPGPSVYLGSPGDRSVCFSANFPTSSVFQLGTRSSSSLHRCFFHELEKSWGLRLAPICPDKSMPPSGCGSGSNYPGLDNPTVVPSVVGALCGPSAASFRVSRPRQQGGLVTSTPQPSVSWVAVVRQCFPSSSFCQQTREILLAAWERSTSSAYSSAWNKRYS